MPLYVGEHGPEAAPSIVFLHGGGGAGWMWRPQVEVLKARYHCLVPDLPEQGESADAGPFTMTGAAALVAQVIRERAHGGRAAVVGLSEGAQVLIALLAAEPDLIERAVVSSALVRPLPGGGLTNEGVVRAMYRLSVAPWRNSDWWIRLNMHSAAGVPDDYFEDFRRSFRETTEDAFAHLMSANARFRLPDGLDQVTAPVLVVCGAREYAAMRGSARDIASAIPSAHAYEVVHAQRLSLAQEHNWSMATPDLFTEVVRAFLEGRPLPPELRPL